MKLVEWIKKKFEFDEIKLPKVHAGVFETERGFVNFTFIDDDFESSFHLNKEEAKKILARLKDILEENQ